MCSFVIVWNSFNAKERKRKNEAVFYELIAEQSEQANKVHCAHQTNSAMMRISAFQQTIALEPFLEDK